MSQRYLRFSDALRLGLRGDRAAGPQLAALGVGPKAKPVVKAVSPESPIVKAARQAAFRPCGACPNPGACRSHISCSADLSNITKARTQAGAAFLSTGAEARRRIAADPSLAARRPLPRRWAPPRVTED